MKKAFGSVIFPATVAATMMFAACGSDDNSSNVERDDGVSSSIEESSSSETSDEKSSSSKEADAPKGTREATLDDLEKNMYLGEMFGTDVYLATGSKQGVFSIWIPDSAWIAVRSDFKNGVLEYGKSNGSYMGTDAKSANEMQKFFEKSGKLKFIVNEKDQLQVSVNDGDYVDVEKANVTTSTNWLSEASNLQGVKLTCKDGEKTQDYTFYKGRYLVEETKGDSSNWYAGYYDIQRSQLLMLPVFFENPVASMATAQVSPDFNLTMVTGQKLDCKKKTFKLKELDSKKLEGEWIAPDGGLDWILKLNKDGSYSVVAKSGRQTSLERSGSWTVYGDQLFLQNTRCSDLDECASAVKGTVEGLDPKSGFTYKHNDVSSAAFPEDWTVPQYE